LSDEFLLSAVTTVGMQQGSIEEGGTRVASFLKQAEIAVAAGKIQLDATPTGLELIEAISALPADQQGFGGVLGGNSEAVAAFRTLRDQRDFLAGLEASVKGAESQNLAGGAIDIAASDPSIEAAQLRARAEGRRDQQARALFATPENLRASAMADIEERWRRESPGFGTEFRIFSERMGAELPVFGRPESYLEQTQTDPNLRVSDPDTQQAIVRELQKQTRQLEESNRRGNSRATTRSE
jgi:hypothetical protein